MDHVMGRWFLRPLSSYVFMIAPAFPPPPWRYIWGWMGTYCRTRTSIQWIPACHGALARDWGRGCWCNLFYEIYIPPENQHIPWKMMVARCISYWNSPFFRDMLVCRGCNSLASLVDEILSIYISFLWICINFVLRVFDLNWLNWKECMHT